MKLHNLPTLFAMLVPALTACSGGGGAGAGGAGDVPAVGTARLAIDITDAPFDHALVESAVIEIDRIRLHVEAEGESGFITVYEGEPLSLDLMQLRNGLSRRIDSGDLPEGDYRQIRLHLACAHLLLTNGNLYTTLDGTLPLTGQDSSGYKVFLDPPIELRDGEQGRVLLDFDLTKTFKPIPGNDPENARKYHLHPIVRASTSAAGELRGVVTLAGEPAEAAELAVVHVLNAGESDLAASVATTATEADGSMAILGLAEGLYDVVAVKDGRQVRRDAVHVRSSGTALVDLTIP